MFEAAELGHKVSKGDFAQLEPTLRLELLELQQRLRLANFPVIIVVAGVDGAGKAETINVLNEWMDPRWIVTRAYNEPSEEERERPEFWRYWRDLPPKGKIGVYLSSWYSEPVLRRAHGKLGRGRFDSQLDRIASFEKTLADNGALILKFWMHLGKKDQKKRLKALEKDPLDSWRVTDRDWKHWQMYDDFVGAAERAIMRTSTGQAPWSIVEGRDLRYSAITVARILQRSISKRLADVELEAELFAQKKAAKRKRRVTLDSNQPTVLRALNTDLALEKDAYNQSLAEQRARLNKLFRRAQSKKKSVLLVFEGWDAGGKGGAIRRLTSALDARDWQVIPIAAPTDEERAHHYLWRFWRHLARAGRLTVFDRSWYGRVLVERVEGFAREDEWQRSYAEINQFEEQLVDHGIILAKYWLHISKDEQLRRFKEREKTPFKRWKLTDEDWRNREQWDLYQQAVNEMVSRTSTFNAPWTLVEGNDKRFARVKVIESLCDQLEKSLKKT